MHRESRANQHRSHHNDGGRDCRRYRASLADHTLSHDDQDHPHDVLGRDTDNAFELTHDIFALIRFSRQTGRLMRAKHRVKPMVGQVLSCIYLSPGLNPNCRMSRHDPYANSPPHFWHFLFIFSCSERLKS